MRRCMEPNDHIADREHGRAIQAIQHSRDFAQAAWHETAAAHLTTSKRSSLRGSRAVQACIWWKMIGRHDWSQQMAQAFLHDKCIPRGIKLDLAELARGEYPSPRHLEGLGSFGAAVPWIFVALCFYGAWKLGRYIFTGSFGPPGTGKLPPAWRAHG